MRVIVHLSESITKSEREVIREHLLYIEEKEREKMRDIESTREPEIKMMRKRVRKNH